MAIEEIKKMDGSLFRCTLCGAEQFVTLKEILTLASANKLELHHICFDPKIGA